ncbi:hypothetical protein [Streptomyces sp. NRRL S-1022]|uniref:hypothetical protein n=1 Tax=Streptomyces sp. NRRL S-1022 TaxID=1463880 RepID=UPI0004BE9366|nr:hypothetical protein [Streptomyces sp. NRRL S-1022]
MAWDEWERLKADAAARGSTGMQLNHVPSEPGGGGAGDLKSDKKAWTKAGEDTKGLQDGISKALGKLDDGQSGLGELSGVQSAAAQRELYESWKKYVGDVKARCGELGGLMEKSGRDLSMTDAGVKAELDRIKNKYQDTEAVGGQAKGR